MNKIESLSIDDANDDDDEKRRDELSFPTKMCMSPDDDLLFVSDSGHNRILAVAATSGDVKFTIGSGRRGTRDGTFDEAEFDWPQGLAYDSRTRRLYIADTFNDRVRVADLASGRVTSICGTESNRRLGEYDYVGGGPGLEQAISSPWDVCLVERPDNGKVLMIACAGTHQIWLYAFPPTKPEYYLTLIIS